MRLEFILFFLAAVALLQSHAFTLDRLLNGIFSGIKVKGGDTAGTIAISQPLIESRRDAPIDYSITELPSIGLDNSLEERHLRDEQLRKVGIFLINMFFNDGDTSLAGQQTTKFLLMKQLLTILLKELKTRASITDNRMIIASDTRDPSVIMGCVELFIVSLDTKSYASLLDETILGDGNPTPTTFRIAKIANLAVDPSSRRSGIASELVNRCLAYAKGIGYDRVMLLVEIENHQAMKFYEKNGFVRVFEKVDQRYNVNGFYLKSEKVKKAVLVKKLSDSKFTNEENATIGIAGALANA